MQKIFSKSFNFILSFSKCFIISHSQTSDKMKKLPLQEAAEILHKNGFSVTVVIVYPNDLKSLQVDNLGVDIRGAEEKINALLGPAFTVNRIQETIYITNKKA